MFFSKLNGEVSEFKECSKIETVTTKNFPVFNYWGMYIGYIKNGKFIKVTKKEFI